VDACKPIIRQLTICLGLLLLTAPVYAQTSSGGALTIQGPVEGRVSAGSEETWTFDGVNGQMLSFYAKDLSGGFDPILQINDSSDVLVSNDDYNYPPQRRCVVGRHHHPAYRQLQRDRFGLQKAGRCLSTDDAARIRSSAIGRAF